VGRSHRSELPLNKRNEVNVRRRLGFITPSLTREPSLVLSQLHRVPPRKDDASKPD